MQLSKSNQAGGVGKVEAKILFIVCYYIIMGTMALTLFTYFEVAGDADRQAVTRHFACQSTGLQSGKDCGEVPNVHLEAFNSLSGVAIILIGLLPAVILAFTVKWNCNKRDSCKRKYLTEPGNSASTS